MKTTILKQSLLLLSSATLLAACGGEGGDSPVDDFGSNPGASGAQALLYAYPDNGQGEVPTKAPIALRFTSNVSPGNVNQSVTLCCDDQGENLDFEVERVGGEPRGVLLTPTDALAPGTQYTVEIDGLRLSGGTAKDQTLTFTTRTLQEGPKSEVVQNMDNFELSRTVPNGSELEPVMDFSAFRFQFTQPIDRATANYGDGDGDGDGNTVMLRDSEGAEVEAGLLVDGAYMTVDPTDDYLTPGETYTLELTGGLESTYGEPFAGETLEFTPKDSSPRGEPGFLVQRITQGGTSRLTGEAINQVPVNGVLLGEDVNVTQAQSDLVIAELADVTQYTDVTPIRLPKGTLLEGTPIEMVKIGGEVDAGFGSGDVTMRVLSDATGYLVPNPYTDHQDNLRIVHLFMDVGIATENPQANGGFTQNLLHIHLVGVAEVDPDGGVLNIDATSMVEPDVLGQEYGYGLLSFQLQSYKDQTDALLADAKAALKDTTPPTLQSWTAGQESALMPSDIAYFQQPGDSIILNFDEPLKRESLTQPGAITLTKDGTPLDFSYEVDGAAVVIQPEGGVDYSPADNNPEYQLQLGSQITDLADNQFVPRVLTFKLPGDVRSMHIPDNHTGEYSEEPTPVASPMLLSAYPGYPCVTDPSTRDLSSGFVGRCAGTVRNWTSTYPLNSYKADDNLPLMEVSTEQSIVLQFTKAIDPASVKLGRTFSVIRVNANGDPINENGLPTSEPETVKGKLDVKGRRIRFTPHEPWGDDHIYKYTLRSNNYSGPASGNLLIGETDATCSESASQPDGPTAICGTDGYPLRTQPLGVRERSPITDPPYAGARVVADHYLQTKYFITNGGGPNLDIFFKASADAENNGVLQTLASSPESDTNNNFNHEVDSVTEKLTGGSAHRSDYFSVGVNIQHYDENGFRQGLKYDHQEPLPTQPDPNNDPNYDPDGVKGLPNSAKVLSTNVKGSISDGEEPWAFEGITPTLLLKQQIAYLSVDGANVGCGYETFFDPATGDILTAPTLEVVGSNPVLCPKRKFTYIKMGLNAIVTDTHTDNGIKVKIWPSQAISSSIVMYARNPYLGGMTLVLPTGEQIMRMRYAKDDPSCDDAVSECSRTSPIIGWIKPGPNGQPVLEADVDLYVDLPYLSRAVGSINVYHDTHSYPISMNLEGPVSFMSDGRMVVEQRNLNPIAIETKMYSGLGGMATGSTSLQIPEKGVFLKMLSEPIKSVENRH